VDYYQIPKAAYYGFKQASKPVITSLNRNGEELEAYVCNDSLKAISGSLKLRALSFSGDVLYSKEESFSVGKNTTEIVLKLPISQLPKLDKNVIIVCDIEGDFKPSRAYYYGEMPLEMPLEKANVTIERIGNEIKVTSDKYARVVELYGNGSFSDNYFDLLPNEEKTVSFDGNGEVKHTWLNK